MKKELFEMFRSANDLSGEVILTRLTMAVIIACFIYISYFCSVFLLQTLIEIVYSKFSGKLSLLNLLPFSPLIWAILIANEMLVVFVSVGVFVTFLLL